MAFSSKTSRLLVLLQIALLVVSAVIMPRSVCHGAGARGAGLGGDAPFDPNRPACLHGLCPGPGQPYVPVPGGGGGRYPNRPGGGGGPGSRYPGPGQPYPNRPGGGGGPGRNYPAKPPSDGERETSTP